MSPAAPSAVRRLADRARSGKVLLLVDQALSSLSNFLAPWMVLATSSRQEFGVFALYYSLYLFLLSMTRELTGSTAIVVLGRAPDEEVDRHRTASAAAAVLLAGVPLLIGVVLMVVQPHGEGASIRAGLLMLGTAAAVVQDVSRHHLIAARRYAAVAVVDGTWVAVTLPAVVWIVVSDPSGPWVVAAWSVGAAVSALVGLALSLGGPHRALPPSTRWLTEHRELSLPFAGEAALDGGATTAATWLSAAVVGAAAIGQIEAARLAMSPITVVAAGGSVGLMARVARGRGVTRAAVGSMARWSCVFAAAAVAWGAALYVFSPQLVGALGSAWPGGRSTIGLAAVVGTAAMAALRPPRALIRGAGDSSLAIRTRAWWSPFLLLGAPIGCLVTDSATGGAIGLALSFMVGTVLWWRAAVHLGRRAERSPVAPAVAG